MTAGTTARRTLGWLRRVLAIGVLVTVGSVGAIARDGLGFGGGAPLRQTGPAVGPVVVGAIPLQTSWLGRGSTTR
jgi:hypothetical protein